MRPKAAKRKGSQTDTGSGQKKGRAKGKGRRNG
jgi:hypothetical protein